MPPKLGGIGAGFARPAAPSSSTTSNAAAGPSTAGAAGTTGAIGTTGTAAPARPKMKFKPVLAPRRVKAEPAPEPVKREPGGERGTGRGRGRGRGRGGAGAGGGASRPVQEMVASGPFAMPSASTGRARTVASSTENLMAMQAANDRKPMFSAQGETYSDDEADNIIDLEVVPEQSGESAPTGLIRDRSIHAALDKNKQKRRVKREEGEPAATVLDEPMVVKAEPVSPVQTTRELPGLAAREKGKGRQDDVMRDEDVQVDMDVNGNRLENGAEQEVVTVQAVDLDNVVIEDYEEDLVADFVQMPGADNPEDKLYLMQFPEPFPNFLADPARSFLKDVNLEDLAKTKSEPMPEDDNMDGTTKQAANKGNPASTSAPQEKTDNALTEAEKEEKAKTTKIQALKRKEKNRKPEGQIGTLVVMKSGKVKMVLGDGIIMDVSPGVATTFIQQLVHIDKHKKNATVLGEVNKSFVMTPDIDNLLDRLRLSDGTIPGEEKGPIKVEA